MSGPQYKEALKMGQKIYRACVARGEYPYLPVLDEILGDRLTVKERDMGLTQVPAEFVVGTRTEGRARVFARNFMPLAGENSEFAIKWERLRQAHLSEGIREPIKAYEYLNRYYVEEGNKRVSVLKYYDAVSIPAHVIRILPEKSEEPEQQRYFELMDFYRVSGLNFIEFSKPGSCARLQSLLGKRVDEPWTEKERNSFTAAYYAFRTAYLSQGGAQLRTTVGDAMLASLEIYGLDCFREHSTQRIRQILSSMWEEITLQQEETPIDVKLTPPEKKQGLISRVLSGGENRLLQVAFVHDGNPENSAWTSGHERGRAYLERAMGDSVRTTAYCDALEEDPQTVLEQAIACGNTTIFTTSPRLLPAALKAAVEHPEVTVFNCSLNQSHRYIRTYYARMYEVKFIIGAIAGSLAGNEPVGYLCDYPIFGQIAGINAFALGVQTVNPRSKVYLEWSSVEGADAALQRLTDRGIRLISSQDMVRRGDEWRSLGLSLITGGTQVNLATPLWQWGTYYEEILRRIRNHAVQSEYTESSKAMNYYWGLPEGVVDLRCSERVPPATMKLAELLKSSMRTGIFNPFQGPLYTQSGKVLEHDDLLTPEQIINMDYLLEDVVGEIPKYENLTDMAKATVDLVGVEPATKDKRS